MIKDGQVDTFRLSFSRCTNHDLAALIYHCTDMEQKPYSGTINNDIVHQRTINIAVLKM